MPFAREINHALKAFKPCDVEFHGVNLTAFGPQFFLQYCKTFGATRTYDEMMAHSGQMAGGGFANAAAGTSQKNDFGIW